jgi:adenine/guanine phosphoribosyltransferase-like PRPP-binding protein
MTDLPDADFWQAFLPAPASEPAVWRDAFLAAMPDGSRLALPLRDLGEAAVAGLIVNQASFLVLDRLIGWMTDMAAGFGADLVMGLPTLGHAVAPGVARGLGHPRWVAAGTTRKLWYDPALSVPTHSITSPAPAGPEGGRRMWLDPRLLPRLRGRRVLLVDDVISTGTSARAGLALLAAAGVTPAALCVAMTQGDRWRHGWDPAIPVVAAFATPRFRRVAGGWAVEPGTLAGPGPKPGRGRWE